MILRNFFEPKLAQASYLIGCAANGCAIVIDPLRDVRPYIDMAAAEGLKIVAVAETHIHADFLSGIRELSAATGAQMILSDEGGADWSYTFSDDPLVRLVKQNDVIAIGNLTLRVMHTPGHTPEHVSFLLTDHPASELPHSLFSGDFVFAGDVGRPDLLERAANIVGTMEQSARQLFRSLQSLNELSDGLLIWPGHGAGSACGKSLGGSPVTSLGYERAVNWAFLCTSEEAFCDEVLAGQPEPPTYFKEMKMRNKQGAPVLGGLPSVPKLVDFGGRDLVDIRLGSEIRNDYLPGTLAIPSGKSLTNWAGWLLEYDRPIVLIADSQLQAEVAARDLMTIGLDVVEGWVPASAPGTPFSLTTCGQIVASDFVLDVRGLSEWDEGHLSAAHHIPLGLLPLRLSEVPVDTNIVVHCAAGGRSPIAVSILQRAGFTHVKEIAGGIADVKARCPGKIV